jgi:O-antigen/teichoic acid export membrane protein
MQMTNEQRTSQIIKNILMNWAAFVATIGIGFVMSPFLVRHLGDEVYGVWVLVGSLVGYLGLLDFGITPSTVKYVAEYRALGDQQAINRLITTSLTVYSFIGFTTLAVSAAFAVLFNRIFHTPLSFNTAAAVVLITGLNLALTFPATVFVGVLRGYQRYDLDGSVTTFSIIIRSVLIVVLIWQGYGILALAVVTFAFDILRLFYLIRCAYKLNAEIAIKREFFDRAELRKLFGYSVFAFLMIVGKRLIFYTDAIVIGIFMSPAAITLYSIANRLVTYLLQVSETMGVLTPTASDLGARNDQNAIKEMLILSTKYMLLVALPVAAVFFILGDRFIALWMGPEYTGSTFILSILTIAVLAHLLEMPAHTVLLGLGKHKIVALFTLAQAIANLILSLVLVKPYGLEGVALGTTIPTVVFTLVAIVIYFKNYLRVSLMEYASRSLPKALLVQLPFVVLLFLIKNYLPPTLLIASTNRALLLVTFFAEILIALIPYGILVFVFCISPTERAAIFKIKEKFGFKRRVVIQPVES